MKEFKTAKGESISKKEIINLIKNFILEKPEYNYKLFIGTDSETRGNLVEFISVIVIHRVGYGARYFWKKIISKNNLDIYSRLWQEAILSLNLSQKIFKFLIGEQLKFDFEVHLDLGTNGKSRSVIKELINLIKSYGFEVKIKPQSYAASKIADHLL
ncbi:MAG: ribonuclease H-like YkuK family protein [Patescibacteria group bacterium]|nr:ribonuclease H-like YkuK family protein [Patescibacteria group bacterium]